MNYRVYIGKDAKKDITDIYHYIKYTLQSSDAAMNIFKKNRRVYNGFKFHA